MDDKKSKKDSKNLFVTSFFGSKEFLYFYILRLVYKDELYGEEIAKKLENKTKKESVINFLKSPDIKKQIVTYSTLLLLFLIFINEIGVINLGKSKQIVSQDIYSNEQIYASGTSFVPKNQNKIFISFRDLKPNSKVYVTFTQNYSPATRYWVSKIDQQNGFLVELDAPVSSNVEFNWWLSL